MAKYKFFYSISNNKNIQQKEYDSTYNINQVKSFFLNDTPNVTEITRIDILDDPQGINTDEALGYN